MERDETPYTLLTSSMLHKCIKTLSTYFETPLLDRAREIYSIINSTMYY